MEQFLREWKDDNDFVIVHTSGSTGEPKPVKAMKEKMVNSATMTCNYLGLREGDSALLCMPTKYIAGKMMIVRSIVRNLDLIAINPTSHPMKDVSRHITFAAMTPMQVVSTLEVDEERRRLMDVDNLIIGGGAIDDKLAREIRSFPKRVFSTYGMTETLSHIAMRRLNGQEATEWYTPMEGVDISLSQDGTLVIYAPKVNDQRLVTNDIAEINDNGQFRIIGRRDNTINSGGIKIQAEEAERMLKMHLGCNFAVTSRPDPKFGEALVLVVDGATDEEVIKACETAWPHHWMPKAIVRGQIPLTGTGKPDRARLKQMAKQETV